MNTLCASARDVRHRLLEGVLVRLARLPDSAAFVLRGGMLLRHWFRPLDRPAGDIDLVATFPFDVGDTARRLVPLLADCDIDDGVCLDPARVRVEGIWLDTPFPGVRMFGAGAVDGSEDEFSADVTFGEPLVPEPTFADYLTSGGLSARLRVCRPETIVGRKLHALRHMGGLHWRAKDLNDIRLLLTRAAMDPDALAAGISASFASRGDTAADARAVLRREWWGRKIAEARWRDFVTGGSAAGAPARLDRVVAEVRERLDPVLGAPVMSDREAQSFLAAIYANPDDDTTRLVYADWLDEHGDAPRAEFIRVQCERAAVPDWEARRVRLLARERVLLKAHEKEWRAELPTVPGITWGEFRRGFVATATAANLTAFVRAAANFPEVAPVEAVEVHWPRLSDLDGAGPFPGLRELNVTGRLIEPDDADRLGDSPVLSTLRTLTLREAALGADGFARLIASPHLRNLRALRVPHNSLGNQSVEALTAANTLPALEELDLSEVSSYGRYAEDPIIDVVGAVALAGWPGLARIRSLTLSGNALKRSGLHALLQSRYATGLKRLALRGNGLTGAAMKEFAGAPAALRLEALDLGENVVRDAGVGHLANADGLRGLKALALDRCELGALGVRKFAKGSVLGGLRVLNLGYSTLGTEGLAALLDANPPELHTLGLSGCNLTDATAAALAASPASDTLLDLDLSWNEIGDRGAQALGAAPHLRSLLALRMSGNPVGVPAATTFGNTPLGKRLVELELPPATGDDEPIPF